MKRISLKRSILVVLMIMMLGLVSLPCYATEELKETKTTVKAEDEDSETKSLEEIKKEMKKGIVGYGTNKDDEEEESKKGGIFDFKVEKDDVIEEKLEESVGSAVIVEWFIGLGKVVIGLVVAGLAVLIGIICLVVYYVKQSKKTKTKTKAVKQTKKDVVEKEEVPYKAEDYEVYAKEDAENFDKVFEKEEVSAYKTLEENGYDLTSDDDEFDMINVGVATPIETEPEEDESNLSPEDKLNKFVKRIETKREVQQKLFDEALPNSSKKEVEIEKVEIEEVEIPEIKEEINPVVEEKEESLLGFDYEEETEEPIAPVVEEKEESLLGFDYEEEKVEEPKVEEPVAPVVPEEKKNEEAKGFSRGNVANTSRKTNRFSFIEIPEEGAEEEKKEEGKPAKIGFTRKGTSKKVAEPKEEVKEEVVPVVEEKEEKKEEKKVEEIDFFAEMEANMKKSKEEREKNKK